MPKKPLEWQTILVVGAICLLAVASRWIPHPPNFTPIGAIALLAGREIQSRLWAILVPLVLLVLGDLALGVGPDQGFIYLSFMLIVLLGQVLRSRSVLTSFFVVSSASLLFFVISNFGTWLMTDLYPKTMAGFVQCYLMAIPFFHFTWLGDLFYSVLLFTAFEVVRRSALLPAYSSLKES